jgi:hypothetical protein
MLLRGKNKIQKPYTIQDSYKSYKTSIGAEYPYSIDYKTYSLILNLYYKEIAKVLLEEGKPFKLMNNLGTLKIVKKKIKFKSDMYSSSIDWENSRKYKKIIYHINEHSSGYKYLYMWDRRGAYVTNVNKYKFVPTRNLKRKLAFYIKNKIRDYFEL